VSFSKAICCSAKDFGPAPFPVEPCSAQPSCIAFFVMTHQRVRFFFDVCDQSWTRWKAARV